ncbi:MAG: heme-binding protein [Gammaproteobacteria bacterium]|nr:heme-binding protein [Gammaproteobacteria bacterium]
MDKLALKTANAMIDAVFVKSKILFAQPSAVVILDEGGHVIALQRQDHAALLRADIAYAKAYGALGMGVGSRGLAKKAKETPDFINGAITVSKGRLIPAPGGVLILNSKHRIIGAIGVSGDSSDNDERAAIFGIKSVNLTPKVD